MEVGSLNKKLTPFQLGQEAFTKGLTSAAQDQDMMTWLEYNTSGEVGSGIVHLKSWNKGWTQAHIAATDISMRAKCSENITTDLNLS